VKDLSTFLHLRKTLGDEIIIAGDFNKDIGSNSTGMSKICRQYHLADSIYRNHGNPQTQFATWIDGHTTLDYILVDHSLLSCINACGYESFQQRIQGDHRGMFIDFNTSKLFGAPDTQLAPMAARLLKSSNREHVTQYFETRYDYLENHNFFNKLEQLKQKPNNKLAEKLDRTFTQSARHAKNRLPQLTLHCPLLTTYCKTAQYPWAIPYTPIPTPPQHQPRSRNTIRYSIPVLRHPNPGYSGRMQIHVRPSPPKPENSRKRGSETTRDPLTTTHTGIRRTQRYPLREVPSAP
jgi:hypothetical protein